MCTRFARECFEAHLCALHSRLLCFRRYDFFVPLRPELATEIAAKITELGRTVLNREEAQRKIGEVVFK